MILYFADRQMNVIGHASTHLPEGLTVKSDLMTLDVETGTAIFECKIPFDDETRLQVVECTEVGNYLLRGNDGENEFYTIIDAEIDTKKQEVYIYAEDAGMDLLNEVVGAYVAEQAYPITYYITKYAGDAGFQIGINEVSGLTRKLSWDGEATAQERILSVATQFDGCEVSFSFDVDGLSVVRKYINIFKKRGQDTGAQLRLNYDVDSIVTSKSIANLATSLQCTGGTPEGSDDPITLLGYSYDDGDFYVDGTALKSREALKKWARLLWKDNGTHQVGGHITKLFSYDTTDQATLCAHALTELKKICDMEVNYECNIQSLPANVKVGDRVNIIDDAGCLYLSTRILTLEESIADGKHKAVLGEYLIRGSGISQKVADLAAEFARLSVSAARALSIANNAKTTAAAAQAQADSAASDASKAQAAADEATATANAATQSAEAARLAAENAQAAVESVEENVSGLQTTIENAQAAADQAHAAAETADAKASEAQGAAVNAKASADEAAAAAGAAQSTADSAATKADTAQAKAAEAKTTADAAKLDAEAAQADIDTLGESLTTLEHTMAVDYARKTDLTEAEAYLGTKVSQNAAQISSIASKVQTVDETSNNALELATEAQAEAAQAAADAAAAQVAADEASAAATAAQEEADTAKTAAKTAQSVADQAEADLAAAEADLATVEERADATAEEIAAAQEAVNAAQSAADTANANAQAAAANAAQAKSDADTAVANAASAQAAANDAVAKATAAQAVADEANGNAMAAQAAADEAKAIALEAKSTADTAKSNADSAQAQADEAATAAATAQQTANNAALTAAQAQADLDAAEQDLANILANVESTEEEIAAAQAAVDVAQAAATTAQEEAEAAQADAYTAQANADSAQAAADDAKAEADEAQRAADEAQKAVDGLAVRMSNAESNITQNAEKIELRATKDEVAQTLGGYYTKEEADAAVQVSADEIALEVSSTYVGSADYEEFKSTVETQLQVLADEIVMTFNTTTEQISNGDGDLQSQLDVISKYIRFVDGDLVLGEEGNELILHIENNRIAYIYGGAVATYFGEKKLVISNEASTQRLEIGVDEDDPYLHIYDANGNLQLALTQTGAQFGNGTNMTAYSVGTKTGVGFFIGG